jgi:hypothetical protein
MTYSDRYLVRWGPRPPVEIDHDAATIHSDLAEAIKYGIFEDSDESKALASTGKCIVQDAVTYKRWIVELAFVEDIPYDYDNEQFTAHRAYIEEEFQKAQKLSASLGEGIHKGKMFSIGVADGMAHYVITKVNKKSCSVEWRGFCLDGYTDHYFGYGRDRVPFEDVEHYVGWSDSLKKLFAKKD